MAAVIARSACRILPQVFNLSSKRTVLCSSNFESKRLLHISRRLLGERKYTKKHEWVSIDSEKIGTIGVTDYAQEKLGEIVFVQLPEVGDKFVEGEEFGALESVKAAADVYMPVSGEITEINGNLEETPDLVNSSPYEKGWLVKIKLEEDLKPDLLSEEEYEQFIKECEEEH